MIGTLLNTLTVIIGSIIGILIKKGIPEKYKLIFFQIIGCVTICLGITMIYNMENIIYIIISLMLGALIGTLLNIENQFYKLSNFLKRTFKIGSDKFNEGLITAFILFCIGPMTFLGTLQAGTMNNNDLLYTKSLLDGISSIILASVFGSGILFSAIPLFLFQSALTLLSMQLNNFLSPQIINGLNATGGVLLLMLGINILEIKKIAIANLLPSLLIIIILLYIFI
ncbi:MAG: DUF554 domain-containing protein [Bacteroidetes bacterium]|nr:DUF554 domain-containing protein [Bacteroidota bacterium]